MPLNIGLLLPRSTDYPAMGFDILDGLRCSLKELGLDDVNVVTDNIGFGEDPGLNYTKAENMVLQHNVPLIICYNNPSNARHLFPLSASAGIPIIFLDAGMQLPDEEPAPNCYHISLQGVHACCIAAENGAKGGKKVLMATSFYDGGYRGPWGYHSSIQLTGGSICGNYVSAYKIADFNITSYLDLLDHSGADCVGACFSTYLAELFYRELKTNGSKATSLPFYCSPFMAEEQLMAKCDFPGGTLYTCVPWSSSLKNASQEIFAGRLKKEKSKEANIFHLLGWEAGIVSQQILNKGGIQPLASWGYDSPRGMVTFHPGTHHTYAPLYYGAIIPDANGKCSFSLQETIAVTEEDHIRYLTDREKGIVSGWKNNYFCA